MDKDHLLSISLKDFCGTLNLTQVAGGFSVNSECARGSRDGWVGERAQVLRSP